MKMMIDIMKVDHFCTYFFKFDYLLIIFRNLRVLLIIL